MVRVVAWIVAYPHGSRRIVPAPVRETNADEPGPDQPGRRQRLQLPCPEWLTNRLREYSVPYIESPEHGPAGTVFSHGLGFVCRRQNI